MSSISSEASLIVAVFQLLAVQDVTNAIRSADIESGDVETPAGFVEQPQRRFLDSDTFTQPSSSGESATVYQRSLGTSPPNETLEIDRYRPKLIEHSQPAAGPLEIVPPIPNPHPSSTSPSPIEPPWKVLPWTDRYARSLAITALIKQRAMIADTANTGPAARGTMIDVVI